METLEKTAEIPVRVSMRTVHAVPRGMGRRSETTETIPAVVEAESGGETEAVEKTGSATTEMTQVWDGRDVAFPPLRPPTGRCPQPGGTAEAAPGTEDSGTPVPTPEGSVETARARRNPAAQVLAVTGARGGLGVSVLLLHLAWALSRAGKRVAMMDLDPAGGLDLLCGETVLTGLRWADLPAEESAFRPGHLVGALPVWHAMPLLTGDVRGGPSRCADAVLEAMRTEHDVVLVDLPRGAPPPPGCRVLLVSGLDLRSAVAAESVAPRLRGPYPGGPELTGPDEPAVRPAVWLVVRQTGEDVVAEDLELITGCPVLGHLPTDRVLIKRLALGEDPIRARSATRRAASALARELLARVLVPEEPEPDPAGGRTTGLERRSESWPR